MAEKIIKKEYNQLDTAPIDDSINPVTSSGIKNALDKKNFLTCVNNPTNYPKLGMQWSGSEPTTFDWACVWADFNGFNKVIAPIAPGNFKKVLSSKLPTIQKILKSLGNVTVSSNGFANISSFIPTAPTGYTFLFAMLNNWSSTTDNNMFLITSNGNYVMAPNGTTITSLRLDYFYILTENMTAQSLM